MVVFVLQMWLVLTGPRESFIGCNVYTCFHAHDFASSEWAGTATRESMVMSSHGQLRYRYHHLGSSHESGGHGVWCLSLVCRMILWSAVVRSLRVFWTRKAQPSPPIMACDHYECASYKRRLTKRCSSPRKAQFWRKEHTKQLGVWKEFYTSKLKVLCEAQRKPSVQISAYHCLNNILNEM